MAVRYSKGLLDKLLGESGVDVGANGLRGVFKDFVIDFYPGGQPSTAESAATATKLGRATLNSAVFVDGAPGNGLEFDAPSGGVISKAPAEVWSFDALGNGTIGWARVRGNAADDELASDTLPRIDMSVGKGSGDLSLSEVDTILNQPHTIDVFNITLLNLG